MKKALKIIGIILLILLVLIVVFLFAGSRRPAVPEDYTKTLKTGGELEAKYLAKGSHEVRTYQADALMSLKRFEIWYPADMTEKTPAVVFCNGTGIKASKYPAVMEHLASWGFIVIGTEEEHSWYGFSAEMCVRLLEKLNAQELLDDGSANPFYQKVDLDRVGVSGHSQGGVGVFNAVTTIPHAAVFRCAFSASPTNKELAHNLMWDYDTGKIHIPILLVSSVGDADEKLVISGEQLADIYGDISDTPFKAMARRTDADHGDMLYYADAYMTAFFLWQLQDDQTAAGAFLGENAELLTNPLYQDQQVN